MYGVGLILCLIVGLFSSSLLPSGFLLWFWIMLAVAALLAYLALGVAWYYIEEGKDQNDGSYTKA